MTSTIKVNNIQNSSGTNYNFIKQVKQSILSTATSTTNTSFTDTGLQVVITPSSTSSKILLMSNGLLSSGNGWFQAVTLDRNGTNIGVTVTEGASFPGILMYMHTDPGNGLVQNFQFTFLDSPSSTSALTYKLQHAVQSGGTSYIGRRSNETNIMCPTFLTAMEVAG